MPHQPHLPLWIPSFSFFILPYLIAPQRDPKLGHLKNPLGFTSSQFNFNLNSSRVIIISQRAHLRTDTSRHRRLDSRCKGRRAVDPFLTFTARHSHWSQSDWCSKCWGPKLLAVIQHGFKQKFLSLQHGNFAEVLREKTRGFA
ncbi:hypothetical protein C8J57DRAFT_1229191 [Mycena rebaudengoi]|nr:hypothetical protein C8J57DRAFT_1229191 [Mycena rebaudengoi]